MNKVLLRLVFTCILSFFLVIAASAQSWMNGYNYRKKITIDKNKVAVAVLSSYKDLVDFPVLIELEDDDLKHVSEYCGNKIQNIEGKDISFALSTDPAVPLSFQLEAYNPARGKMTCWVKIPSLSAWGTASLPTSVYLYYGSTVLHEPYSPKNLTTWSSDYTRVWHMNQDNVPAESRNAQSNAPEQSLIGSSGITSNHYIPGKVNRGVMLNGLSESLSSDVEATNPEITVSAWIKINAIGREQVIITNKMSLGTVSNGYIISISSSGELVMDLFIGNTIVYTLKSLTSLTPNVWYYVTGLTTNGQCSILINGVIAQSKAPASARLGAGGTIKIGSSKNNDQYFNGTIDELRIQKVARSTTWLSTEYTNQNNPTAFYSIGPEEYSSAGFAIFTGSKNNLWNVASNWSNGVIPGNNASVIISSGKTTDIPDNTNIKLKSLVLEQNASLTINSAVDVSCIAKVASGASIKLANEAIVGFASDVVNNGSISLSQTRGTLVFSGDATRQRYSGAGIARVHRLENKQIAEGNVLTLDAPIQITGFVELNKGILNSNGHLTLLSNLGGSASVLPILNLNAARVIGNVNVQTYISGDYPGPATARGWRLLSSPVYTNINGGMKYYAVNAFQNSMYVTGKGGSANGFDPSPLNGGTIYTHDQSLPGTLSQKYTAIPNISTNIPFGSGVYVFSRGYREAPNSYINQIQTAPFSNPTGYVITHSGLIYTGDLAIGLSNKNANEVGEGFNLLGNPYPAPIQWGNLLKTNLSSFVWLFDPLNNAYVVSNAPSTIIPSGSGFFVKVLDGNTSGSLKFEETSKYIGNDIPFPRLLTTRENSASLKRLQTRMPYSSQESDDQGSQLTIQLKREAFEQQYVVSFVKNGIDDVNDKDAMKIGEGYVSIAGVINGTKLSFDERTTLTEKKEIQLFTKGWDTGLYCLNLQGLESFSPTTSITLTDKYLNISREISPSKNNYCFSMDEKITESWGNRFMLTLEPFSFMNPGTLYEGNGVTLYPNPIINKFYIKNSSGKTLDTKLTISNIYGQILLTKYLMIGNEVHEINAENLTKGIYLISLFDKVSNKSLKTFKVIKR
nr:LamG-like jellyroll fold domain-containing protein [uncultured Pedobacter sp.]